MNLWYFLTAAAGSGVGLLICLTRQWWLALREAAGRHLIDQAVDGLVLLDRKGRVRYINGLAAHLLGVDPRQSIRRPWSLLFAGQTQAIRDLVELSDFETASHWTRTLQLAGSEGHRHVTLCADVIHSPRRRKLGTLLQFADMTDVQHREEALEVALQEQRALTIALTEVSSPILPVGKQTILLPLVGSLDQSRMATTAEALLSGIRMHRARLAILDLTAVSHLSPDAVDTLLQTIDAMRLLGTEPILVGIQPQVAEALGGSPLDLHTLSIYNNLQAGLEHAAHAL